MNDYTLFLNLSIIACVIGVIAAAISWRARRATGIISLTWFLGANAGYLFFSIVELLEPSMRGTYLFAELGFVFSALMPVAWLVFSFEYNGFDKWFNARHIAPLFIVPAISIVLLLSNDFHGLIWKDYVFGGANGLLMLKVKQYGAWSYVHFTYSYLLYLIGTGLTVAHFFRAKNQHRKQSSWVVAGALLPLAINLFYLLQIYPKVTKDFSPIGFAMGGVLFAIGIFRYRLLDLMPLARAGLIDRLREGVVVLNRTGRIVDANPAARRMLAFTAEDPIGLPVRYVIPGWLDRPTRPGHDARFEASLPSRAGERQYDIQVLYLEDPTLFLRGSLLVLRDITDQKKLVKELESMARVDPLTGIFNRRTLLEQANREVERGNRHQHPMSVLLLDLDNFKKINDTHGHLAGDRVMKELATRLKVSLNEEALLARFGGDEFIVLLRGANREQAFTTAESLRTATEFTRLRGRGGETFEITTSIGGCVWDGKTPSSLDILLECADQALYESKSVGGNRTTIRDA